MKRLIASLGIVCALATAHQAWADEMPTDEQMNDLHLACQLLDVGRETKTPKIECLRKVLPQLMADYYYYGGLALPPCKIYEGTTEQVLWFAGVVVDNSDYFKGRRFISLNGFIPVLSVSKTFSPCRHA